MEAGAAGGVEGVAAVGGGGSREGGRPAIVVVVVGAASAVLRRVVGGTGRGDVIVCRFPLSLSPLRAGGPVPVAGGTMMACFNWRRAAVAPWNDLVVLAGGRPTMMVLLQLL